MNKTTRNLSIASLCLLSSLSLPLHATQQEHVLIVPDCLVAQGGKTTTLLSQQQHLSLVKTNQAGLEQFIAAKADHRRHCGGFINVSRQWQQYQANPHLQHNHSAFLNDYLLAIEKKPALTSAAYKIRYKAEVRTLLKTINSDEVWSKLTTLTNFEDRYANSEHGVAAADWFVQQVKALAAQYHREDITVTTIATDGYKQPSVVVKVGNSTQPGIVIGGHLDTLSSHWSKKPGADDDGSGSVTVLETARTLIASGMRFNKPIYFMWYAAEEEGLYGSQQVVDAFKEQHIPIAAVIHFDMTGYAHQNEKTMWLIDDNVNPALTTFLETLITTYVKRPVEHSTCGYACSDHASWTFGGTPSALRFK